MYRLLIVLLLASFSAVAAPSFYQIDLIVFTHVPAQQHHIHPALIIPHTKNSVDLGRGPMQSKTPYQCLPATSSQLEKEYWALSHQAAYQVLFHRSWLQPFKNEKPVAISEINRSGWTVNGFIKVKRGQYYVLDSSLRVEDTNHRDSSFVVSLKKRLKPKVVYYLDNPTVGLLIKIHRIT